MAELMEGVVLQGPFPLEDIEMTIREGKRCYDSEVDSWRGRGLHSGARRSLAPRSELLALAWHRAWGKEQEAEKHWQALRQEQPQLFDGEVWCLSSFSVQKDPIPRLRLEMQETSFKYVLYTHLTTAGQSMDASRRSGACGLMALTETTEGLLVFGQRSRHVGAFPGYFHCVPAGNVDVPDLLQIAQKELLEEMAVAWEEVASCSIFALMDTGAEQGHKYEFVLSMRLSLPAPEVLRRYQIAEDKKEHEAFVFVRPRGVEPVSSVPTVTSREFLAEYQITDVARRSLQLLDLTRQRVATGSWPLAVEAREYETQPKQPLNLVHRFLRWLGKILPGRIHEFTPQGICISAYGLVSLYDTQHTARLARQKGESE
ncbi:unnamed protein product [Effrenium voratum]|nr:unnamed protein product [Effrenium voratum]